MNESIKKNSQDSILINRPVYTLKKFDSEYQIDSSNASSTKNVKSKKCNFSPINFLSIFTILNFITEYNFKQHLVPDILSGLTVGVMHIPSSLAYGALTSLNPVHGLYTSFFAGLTYILFGTSKHLSVGTFAVTSLIVYSTITRIETEYPQLNYSNLNLTNFESNNENSSLSSEYDVESITMNFKIKIATGLAFWCGIIQVIFSFLKFGSISKYLSQPLLRGFTTAASFHVFSSQIKHILGIYYVHRKRRKFFKLVYLYLRLFQNIHLINWAAFIFSITSILFLYITRTQINERFKKQLKNVPLPIELFVIVTGTILSNYANLNSKFNMSVIGTIPKGLPEFRLPEFNLFFDLFLDAIIISIIAYATSLSVSDIFARKHKYKIDSNKEFFALGVSNVVGSFFQSFVSCGSLSRTVVADSSGGKTQLVTLIASSVVLTVMLWLGPFLEQLPKACLGSIIIAALVNLLLQVKDIPYYWKLDKLDFVTWIVTFMSTIILDVDFGLCLGFLTALFMNTYRTQKIDLKIQGRVKDFEIYRNIDKYLTSENDTIKIVSPNQSIFYLTSDCFKKQLNLICPLKATGNLREGLCENCKANYKCLCGSTSDLEIGENEALNRDKKFDAIVLNFTDVQFVDEAGCKCLQQVIKEYENENVKVLLACCNEKVVKYFKKMRMNQEEKVYLTVQDAVNSLL
ncbi:unnamed protein product [Brachionus calyciflorus]|uniref:STAS domain-containing protein n=1 Tax=Brachionus calyciflorus TaxID=104777 RepID=A0A813M748_9BILA|nr:unnamed protein product [Brachionus calyciflorus]